MLPETMALSSHRVHHGVYVRRENANAATIKAALACEPMVSRWTDERGKIAEPLRK